MIGGNSSAQGLRSSGDGAYELITYLEIEAAWLGSILEFGFLSALLIEGVYLRQSEEVSRLSEPRVVGISIQNSIWSISRIGIGMSSYFEKLIVGRLSLQLLAVGDCLLEFGGLGDHDDGIGSSKL